MSVGATTQQKQTNNTYKKLPEYQKEKVFFVVFPLKSIINSSPTI
jgi:hypothetical protein